MIVKNEAHIIKDTLRHLLKYIPIDAWSICDTGSTDSTKEDIIQFFSEQNIPGKIHNTEWKDFGHNRTVAFEKAAGVADYMFVWDADDSIEGNFIFPTDLQADSYKFLFGNKSGFRYSRCQLFSSRKQWKYVGVLHEYPACVDPSCGSPAEVAGDYYFVSGRSGARNKNPMKYQDDARILEAAYSKAKEEKDPIHCRYAFYCAQSYASANMHEKAIEYYRIVLTLESWTQEKYMSCLSIYNHLTALGKEQEGLAYLVESFRYDRTRMECIYRLIKYYCIKGLPEVAFAYYGLIQNYFETQYVGEKGVRDRLFANIDEYDFYLPYYMIIVADRIKRHDVSAKMYDIIFTKRFTATTKWWIDNLMTNAQFCCHVFPKTTEFLGKLFDYVNELRRCKIYLDPKHNAILTKIVEMYTPVLCAAGPPPPPPGQAVRPPRVMLTMTTCKRLELFRKTVCSIFNTWTDVAKIEAFFCVDDNSSEEDRNAMRTEFPFFEYYMKGPGERGHKESMNIIWKKLSTVKPTYWIHLEDDWMFFHRGSYVERGIGALESYKGQHIHQVVFNRNYGVVYNDLERTGGFEQNDRIILHELNPNLPGRHSGYWPHYSLQPSICRTATILQLGDYTTTHRFFERGYAEKYNAAGYKTAFFDSVYSTHIGKQHWDTDGKNAYALNNISQFQVAPAAQQQNRPLVGSMSDHLDLIIGKIRAQIPFGLIRPSDGEYTILMNKTLTNCDAWTWKAGGALRQQLAESICTVNPNLYIGIPCNSCNKAWNCTEEIYTNYTEKFAVPPAQITYANIFMNSNWSKWKDFIQNYTGELYMVGSGTEPSSLPIKARHVISATLVNSWDTDGQTETSRLYSFIDKIQGQLICFAAGPLSKVWIPLCMKRNPANMYVDVGASLDIFTKGLTNRMYISPSHPFAKETCVFRQSPSARVNEAMVSSGKRIRVPTKNLLYFCVFHNRDYCRLARLLLTSMRIYSSINAFDILVMTTEDFRSDLETIATELHMSIEVYALPLKTIFEAACARLKIFKWNEIGAYNTILYLDTDILIKGDLTPLFEIPKLDKLYGIQSGTIASRNFGRDFFKGWVDHSKTGFNSGTLLFKNSPLMHELFENTWTHAMEHALTPPACMDQPFLNYNAIKDGLHNNTDLNPFVSLYEDNDIVINESTSLLCHFSYPIGNFAHKFQRMTTYFLKGLSTKRETSIRPVGKIYSWGSSGSITFGANGLETTWGNGIYEVLGEDRVKASWNGYDHFLTFLNNGTEYVSVRTKPEDYGVVFGKLQNGEKMYIHGDSHAMLLFKGLTVPHENLFEYGTTMHKIGRDDTIPKHFPAHNSKNATFVFVYGEVDCRAHIKRQVESGHRVEEVCQTLVKAYCKTIKSSITTSKTIIIVGVPPPVDEADHRHEHPLPFIGTKEVRVDYTRRMNSLLEVACAENGFVFFAPFQKYTRADGCLDYSLSDDCIHIGKNADFLQEFVRVLRQKPEYPLILHTCDKYERFWNNWYFFFKKYVRGIHKVYFLTEKMEPVFSEEVTVIKTGVGHWGRRLITALEQIPEPYVYYMQEDFWAAQPFHPGQYTPMFFEYGMDALRISVKSPLYSLDLVKDNLYKFKQKSDYLMTHQFSLWKRDYFRKWIRAKDEPWQNEMEQSVEIAKAPHAIYLLDLPWYEATVRRGVLQPNGEELLRTHSEEIAKSFVKNDWYTNFLLKIREHLATDPIETFSTWKILELTMFTVANSAQRAAIGYEGELPECILERNKLHHRFMWAKFGQIVGQTPLNGIFEFGGGYGQLRKVVYETRAEIPYAICDFPELHAIQRNHLKTIPTEFYTNSDSLPTDKYNVFVSFWAYTECPKEVRDSFIPFFKAAAFDILFFGLAQTFQLDNIAYLKGLADTLGYSVEFVPINEMKSHDGTQFFGVLRAVK